MAQNNRLTFGQKLLALRKAKGWTQAQVGAALGITQAAYSLLELDRIDPKRSRLRDLAVAFDVRAAYFVED